MTGLAGMITRRVRKLIAWIVAAGVVGLVLLGLYYAATVV